MAEQKIIHIILPDKNQKRCNLFVLECISAFVDYTTEDRINIKITNNRYEYSEQIMNKRVNYTDGC